MRKSENNFKHLHPKWDFKNFNDPGNITIFFTLFENVHHRLLVPPLPYFLTTCTKHLTTFNLGDGIFRPYHKT